MPPSASHKLLQLEGGSQGAVTLPGDNHIPAEMAHYVHLCGGAGRLVLRLMLHRDPTKFHRALLEQGQRQSLQHVTGLKDQNVMRMP